MMNEKELITKDLATLIEIREAFLAYLDEAIPKDKSGIAFDFSNHPTLDAKSVYEHFYKLDYQARKIRGFVVKNLGLNP